MFILFYVVIPFFMVAYDLALLANLGDIKSATEAVLVIVCMFVPFVYGYFLWRRAKPTLDSWANYDCLLHDLINFIQQDDDYIWVGLEFSKTPCGLYNSLWFKDKYITDYNCFNFNTHGYDSVSEQQMLRILRDLEGRTGGYLKIYTGELGGYTPSVTVTPGIMPGGGEGYYVNVGDYDTCTYVKSAYLILGDEAEKYRQADRNKKCGNGLRKI